MSAFINKHVFTAELPYEKDAAVTNYFRQHFHRVDDFIMSMGQMSKIPPSKFITYLDGKLVGEREFANAKIQVGGMRLYLFALPKAIISNSLDFLRALKEVHFKCDIFFAQHFLPAFWAIILRRLGILKCEKIIYWMFDFFLIPPEFLRGLYYRGVDLVQGFIRKNVNEIWYLTPRLAEVDKQRFGKLPNKVKIQFTEGCFFKRIKVKEPPKAPPLALAFLGSLRINNAVYESIDCVKYCLDKGLKVELHIIGSGPEEQRMKVYVEKLKIKSAVKFYGFEDRGEKIAKIFSQCHLGLALYSADAYSPNWYLASGKFRRFISQRLPVITTPVPYFIKYLHEYNAGLIVDSNPADFYKALKKIYNNPSLLKSLVRGVDTLYPIYETDKVFGEAFAKTLNR